MNLPSAHSLGAIDSQAALLIVNILGTNHPFFNKNSKMESAQNLNAGQQPNPYPNLDDAAYQLTSQGRGQPPSSPGWTVPPPAVNMNPGYPQAYPQRGPSGQVVYIKNNNTVMGRCQFCQRDVPTLVVKRKGCAVYSWFCVLFWLTGCCCWIPCVMDECYDIKFQCTACYAYRQTIKSSYCL